MEGKRQLEKRDFGKRLSLDSSLVEYMDSNKYIEHLLTQLEEQHRSLWREKLAVARLQREVAQRRSEGAMHEKLIHELEEERHLRLQSEKRLQEVTLESERNRIQMRGLQQQFSRMEETVRNLLQSQGPPEQKKEETVNIMVYQEKLSEEERKHKEALEDCHMVVDEDSRSEGSSADEGKEKTKLLLERLKALEAENSALALENENQREQYERCLDEVANQVVQALLTQKDLREECVKLKTRVFDLEQQNRTLSILFQQRVRPTSDLLLQKLHSRILNLSTGDLLSDVERSRSLTHSRTDVEMHECQLNTNSGTPALKRPGMGVAIHGYLCPRSSCSGSELSLSSTCSEYSSGSSCAWHDGKDLRKRQSSQNWDKRVDKKAAQQTESGSNNVSCRSVLKGSSQGSCVTGSSIGAQGTHKKNIKTKADVEIPKGSLIKEANEHLEEDEEDTVADSAFQSHTIETNCQMRTLDSGIGTFPLPDSGNRSAGRYTRHADSPEDTEPLLSLQPALCAASSIRARTLEREVPSSADSRGSADSAIVHSTSDPIVPARGMRPLQSRLPKPASSGKINSQMQSEAKPTPQTCSSFEYAENTAAAESKPLLAGGGDSAAAETQKLKQVEETREDPENRLCKISLESFSKYNGNTVILLEKETNSLNKVEGQKEEKEKNEEPSLSNSDRPGVDNLESLSDSLYDSFSSCASQGSNDV
ncbi:nck-associated protein 5 isoform X9 [Physeter macrocephalus]|uniref:Nck-associated protein 5 isoform X9 n=1 Tax=Physeter macrocephalus TaxID=9755 RepID=A0A9W2WVE6_PHYMC|nr:nck-associated protein 5 isoform X9 [Physeter catodon]